MKKTGTIWSNEDLKKVTLLRATTNGVLRCLSKLIDSMVCGSKPCIISMTKTAMSHREEPRDLKLLHTNTKINVQDRKGYTRKENFEFPNMDVS